MVDAQIRERAFFMAGVSNARILQDFKDAARDIAAGKLTTNEARKRLRAALREAGYEPAEDERGGIHDLSSRRRIDGLYKYVKTDKQPPLGISSEGESWMPGDIPLRVVSRHPKITRTEDGRVIYEIWVEEP